MKRTTGARCQHIGMLLQKQLDLRRFSEPNNQFQSLFRTPIRTMGDLQFLGRVLVALSTIDNVLLPLMVHMVH